MIDFVFQRWQQQNHSHALLMMWFPPPTGYGVLHSLPVNPDRLMATMKGTVLWLLKLDQTLPLLGMHALGTQPPYSKDAQATTWTDHYSSWHHHWQQQRIAEDVTKWALRHQATPAFESSQQRPQTSYSWDKANALSPFQMSDPENLWT